MFNSTCTLNHTPNQKSNDTDRFERFYRKNVYDDEYYFAWAKA